MATGRLFVDASGNVGVGLTPASYAGYSVIGHGSTTGATLEQRVNGSLVGSLTTNTQVTLTSLTAIPIVLSTNNTERLRITSAGLVGIGTASVNALLEVNNSTAGGEVQRIEGNYDGSGSVTLTNWRRAGGSVAAALKYNDDSSPLCMSIGTTTSHEFRIRTADTDAITIDASQRVGIGTSSPAYKLDVVVASSKGIGAFAPASSAGITDFSAGGVGWTFTRPYDGGYIHSIYSYDTAAAAKNNFVIQSRNDIVFTYGGDHTNSIETMRLTDGKVGIGTTSPPALCSIGGPSVTGTVGRLLQVYASGATGPGSGSEIWLGWNPSTLNAGGGVTIGGVYSGSGSDVVFSTPADSSSAPTEKVRIDSSGRLLVGTSSSVVVAGSEAVQQIVGTPTSDRPIGLHWGGAGIAAPYINFSKSRNATYGSYTIVNNGDGLGGLLFAGDDGTDYGSVGAAIEALVDGTPGANDMPGRLVFSTTADGASSPTERLRITSAGFVGIGTSTPSYEFQVNAASNAVMSTSNSSSVTSGNRGTIVHLNSDNNTCGMFSFAAVTDNVGTEIQFHTRPAAGSLTQSMTLDSTGRLGIGTTSPGNFNQVVNAPHLVVGGGTTSSPGLTLYSTTSGAPIIAFADGTAGNQQYRGYLQYDHTNDALISSASSYQRFDIAGSEGMRLDSSKRLLIGTSTILSSAGGVQIYNTSPFLVGCKADNNPTQGAVLMGMEGFSQSGAVFAEAAFVRCESGGSTSSGNHPGQIIFGTTATGTSSTERMRIDSSGRVGIGTSAPASTLHIQHAAQTAGYWEGKGLLIHEDATANQGIAFYSRGDTEQYIASLVDDPTSYLIIGTRKSSSVNAVDAITIRGDGKVGIGTTSPSSLLEISSSSTPQFVISNTSNSISAGDSIGTIDYRAGSSNTVVARMAATADSANEDGAHIVFENRTGGGAFSEKARIDSSGRLLVGTSTARGNFYGAYTSRAQIEGVDFETAALNITCNNATDINSGVISLNKSGGATVGSNTIVSSGERLGSIRFQGNDGTNFIEAAYVLAEVDGTPGPNDMPGRLVFSTTADGASSPTERFRVTADGSIYFHSTSLPGAGTATTGVGISAGDALSVQRAAATACFFGRSDDGEVVALYSGTTQRGTISIAGATTTYGSISDHRLKENVAPIGNATSRLAQLKPSRFNFVEFPEQEVDGFIAHEVQAIVPEAVIGTKDATDKNGKPLYQSVDQSKLVPLLTAALQEAVAKIESLEARLTAAGL
jgi:hypothetical protein